MAALIDTSLRPAKKKLHSLKIDMTPMVDLGFLLITFFIFTTSLMEPTITKLVMPSDGEESPVPESKIITAILENDKVLVYEGMFEKAMANSAVIQTNYHVQTGLGKFIRQKQKKMNTKKDDLMVAIKPMPSSSYQQVMNALDEMRINNVLRYAIVNVSDEERNYLVAKPR